MLNSSQVDFINDNHGENIHIFVAINVSKKTYQIVIQFFNQL